MGGFQELGKMLDKLAERLRSHSQEGAEDEIKGRRKKLDELREIIKEIAREGIQRLTLETKEVAQVKKLMSEVSRKRKEVENALKELGEKTYQLHLKKRIGNVELKKLSGRITALKRAIEAKEKDIQRLRDK